MALDDRGVGPGQCLFESVQEGSQNRACVQGQFFVEPLGAAQQEPIDLQVARIRFEFLQGLDRGGQLPRRECGRVARDHVGELGAGRDDGRFDFAEPDAEVHAFVSAVAEGRPPLPDGEAGLKALVLAEAAVRSNAERRTVEVAEI